MPERLFAIFHRRNNLIITRLFGGLGNQMFQYASGRRMALENNVQLKLDLSWFRSQTKRTYRLNQFQISTEIATEDEIYYYKKNRWLLSLLKTFQQPQLKYPQWLGQIIEYHGSDFFPQVLQPTKRAYLDGYWQSERYFSSIAPVIRQEFQLAQPFSDENKSWVEKVNQPSAVSVHIRRQDYVFNAQINSKYYVCDPEYYKQAAVYLSQQIPNAYFIIFSDDLSWARQNMDFLSPASFVNAVGPRKDEEELMLMSLCHHHIIANSTFSWWGAWLGEAKDSSVIVPGRWFKEWPFPKNLIPNRWIIIE